MCRSMIATVIYSEAMESIFVKAQCTRSNELINLCHFDTGFKDWISHGTPQ